jgi:hypothetical protein
MGEINRRKSRNIMNGIEYIRIINGNKKDWRFDLADKCQPYTEDVLRKIFSDAGMDLLESNKTTECDTGDLIGRYDLVEGIDIILRFKDGTKGTLQQKTLFSDFKTVTFEEYKNSNKPGAWYYCTAQYYFVIYTNESQEQLKNILYSDDFSCSIRDAMLINLAELHKLSLNNSIKWNENRNRNDGRRSPFRYIFYNDVPDSCIIGKWPIEYKLF